MTPRPPAPGSPAPGLPLPRRPAHRFPLAALAVALLITGMLLIPAVSANEIFNKTYTESEVTNIVTSGTQSAVETAYINNIVIANEYFGGKLNSLIWQTPLSQVTNRNECPISDYWDVTITGEYSGITYYTGEMGYFKYKVGSTDYLQLMLFIDDGILKGFDDADIYSGCVMLRISPAPSDTIVPTFNRFQHLINNDQIRSETTTNPITGIYKVKPGGTTLRVYKDVTHAAIEYSWANNLVVIEEDQYSDIYLNRNVGSGISASTIIIQTSGLSTSDTSADSNYHLRVVKDLYPFSTNIYNPASGSWFNETFHDVKVEPTPTPTDAPVTVYIKNSQTGALLADARLSILASAGGTETEVVNATLPGGTGTYTLQPTGGGDPNPDFYRLIATLDGYNSQMPYIDFELTGATTLYVYMEPTAGGPDDENKTYIEFYVRDLSANPIAGAAVTCGGYTLITNSAGYTQFELPNNAAYPYRVTKSGYVTIEGRATVTDAPRHTVNVVLGPGETPTSTPTATPTGWGPGQWTPDPGDSIGDNARDAAKQTLLEGLQAGQLLFTLCILVLIMAVLDSRRR